MRKIPQTDSVSEMAHFWDAHDLTEFEDELEEVTTPVFGHSGRNVLRVTLPPDEAEALHHAARKRGIKDSELAREWLNEKLRAS